MGELPFLERAGVREPEFLESLQAEPERLLSAEQMIEVREFASNLFNGRFEDLTVNVPNTLSLGDVVKLSEGADTQGFNLDYFTSPEGRVDAVLLGCEDLESIRSYLTDITHINAAVDTKLRKQIAARSVRWHDQHMEKLLLSTVGEDDQHFKEPEAIVVNYNPKLLLEKFSALREYRRFFHTVKTRLANEEATDEGAAKVALLDMHSGRTTELIAELYSSMVSLTRQMNERLDIAEYDHYGRMLEDAAPDLVNLLLNNEKESGFDEAIDQLQRRLDYVRNGAAMGETDLTPLAPQVLDALNAQPSTESELAFPPLLPPDLIESMKHITWNAEQAKTLVESVLRQLGVLSTYTADWEAVRKRNGSAEDGNYQVIVDPNQKTSLSVDTFKKVVLIGEGFSRGLIDRYPAGVLPGVAHEVLHVLQGQADEHLSQTIPLAGIKGRRYLTVREGGGIANEQAMHRVYFGQDRKANPYYALALQTKLAGGNRMQVARTFHEAFLADEDDEHLSEAEREKLRARVARAAVDRSARLYRHHGHNSQPLNYVEQELIARKLANKEPTERDALLLRLGSFNVRDAAILHKFGLYPVSTPFDDINLPTLVLATYLNEFTE